MFDREKTITLSFNDFQEISTDVAAKLCAVLDQPELAMFSALLLANISKELFANENIIIDKEEQ